MPYEPWQRKLIGTEEVGEHRGYTLIKSPAGTYGFNAWMSRKENGWWCPYIDEDGARKAIDCILDYLVKQTERSD